MSYLLSLDQGTSASKAVLYDDAAQVVAIEQVALRQLYPHKGWVEHRPKDIWEGILKAATKVIRKARIQAKDIKGIGITNQRETTIVWDRATGNPIHNAIVWQDRRTAAFCNQLILDGHDELIREKTGLRVDAYFSASKIAWLLNHVKNARSKAIKGELLFGTVESWLLYNLTKGEVHATDVTNASRTMLFDIDSFEWSEALLKMMGIPEAILPTVHPNTHEYGTAHADWFGARIPILAMAGDQQASLFGQLCRFKGMAKNTYGTGCFMLMNTGSNRIKSTDGMLSTIAWHIGEEKYYALEGSVFNAGSVVTWLQQGMGFIESPEDASYFAQKVESTNGVYVVPAFTGLGAPHWDMYARGSIFGLTRDSNKNEIIRATLESVAFQSKDVLGTMEKEAGIPLRNLRVDGGLSKSDFLMQFQADILNVNVERSANEQSTAFGVAMMAGIQSGLWKIDDLTHLWKSDEVFLPKIELEKRKAMYDGWRKAIKRTKYWAIE